MLRIRNVITPTIEVHLPSGGSSNGIAVLICPGGGYNALAYDWEGTDVADWLNSHGIAGIVLKYRLPNAKSNQEPRLSPLLDAKRAMRTVRANAEKWNLSPHKIGVMGFSAGGHLASSLGTRFDTGDTHSIDQLERASSRPDFMVLVYPVISLYEDFGGKGTRKNLLGENPPEPLAREYSNELNVKANTPPTFITHASDDAWVLPQNSLTFYEACLEQGVPVEMHLYPYGGHGYSFGLGRGRIEKWRELCIDWILEHANDRTR